MSETEHMQVKT